MQITATEAMKVLAKHRRHQEPKDDQVKNVRDLAREHCVDLEGVESVVCRAIVAKDDPLRERRIRILASRVADGTYQVDCKQIVDMAERRAIADGVR
jgi:hypothetical protein